MHVGNKISYCPELKMVENFQTGEQSLEDVFIGEHVMDESEKYNPCKNDLILSVCEDLRT